MSRKAYKPSPAGDAKAHLEGKRWTLVFVRELRHPPQRVWSALTDPGELREWAPFDPDRDLKRLGAATLTMAGGDGSERSAASVRRADPPVLLEYTWDEDILRWELEPTMSGTRLTLRHTVGDKKWIPKVAAGWHICLDVADQLMAGEPVGRIVADEAKQHGWEELNAAYSAQLGIANTGWPEKAGSAPRGASRGTLRYRPFRLIVGTLRARAPPSSIPQEFNEVDVEALLVGDELAEAQA